MITYFLPGHGIFGGIKVAYQFVDALASLGFPARIASPLGESSTWFDSTASVVDRDAVLAEPPSGVWVFSYPPDYGVLRTRSNRLVFHCQGTNALIDAFIDDPNLTVLTCWEQAFQYCAARGANPIDVGIAISDCFFYGGDSKTPKSLAWMPRRGRDTALLALNGLAHLEGLVSRPIEGMHELEVAQVLRETSVYMATSEAEWFGLPALEALAAGCLVVSVPVLGGSSYLAAAQASVVSPEALPEAVERTLEKDRSIEATRLRIRGISTAASFSLSGFRARMSEVLDDLRW